jgi:hypothetical protein
MLFVQPVAAHRDAVHGNQKRGFRPEFAALNPGFA